MLQELSNPEDINNPCYPIGVNVTIQASAIYDTECTKKPKNYSPDQQYVMVGSGNSDQCGRIVNSIFDFTICSSAHCSFNGVEQPPVTGEFMVRRRITHTHTDTFTHYMSNIYVWVISSVFSRHMLAISMSLELCWWTNQPKPSYQQRMMNSIHQSSNYVMHLGVR